MTNLAQAPSSACGRRFGSRWRLPGFAVGPPMVAAWRKPWTARARVVREPLKRTVLDPERGAHRRNNNEIKRREPALHGRRPCPVAARRQPWRGRSTSGRACPRCPWSDTGSAASRSLRSARPLIVARSKVRPFVSACWSAP